MFKVVTNLERPMLHQVEYPTLPHVYSKLQGFAKRRPNREVNRRFRQLPVDTIVATCLATNSCMEILLMVWKSLYEVGVPVEDPLQLFG